MNANFKISESHLSGPVDIDWKIAETKKAILHATEMLFGGFSSEYYASLIASRSAKLAALMLESGSGSN